MISSMCLCVCVCVCEEDVTSLSWKTFYIMLKFDHTGTKEQLERT